jgi:hypothetical protein
MMEAKGWQGRISYEKNVIVYSHTFGCQWFSHVWDGEEIMSIGKIGWEAKEK